MNLLHRCLHNWFGGIALGGAKSRSLALLGLLLISLLVAAVPASAQDGGGADDEFSWATLISAAAGVAGAGIGAGATTLAAKSAREEERRREAEALRRTTRDRVAVDARELSDAAAAAQGQLAIHVARGGTDREAREGVLSAVTDLQRRTAFVVDEELRDLTTKFSGLALRAMSAQGPETREIAEEAGRVLDVLTKRAGKVYIALSDVEDLAPSNGSND